MRIVSSYRIVGIILLVIIVPALLVFLQDRVPSTSGIRQVVGSRETASAIAKAVIKERYGWTGYWKNWPLKLTQQTDRWEVRGTRWGSWLGAVGGEVHIDIAKEDGRVIRFVHTK